MEKKDSPVTGELIQNKPRKPVFKSIFGKFDSMEKIMATPATYSARSHAKVKARKLAKETGEYVEIMLFRSVGRYVLTQGEKIYCRDNVWRTEDEALVVMGLPPKK